MHRRLFALPLLLVACSEDKDPTVTTTIPTMSVCADDYGAAFASLGARLRD